MNRLFNLTYQSVCRRAFFRRYIRNMRLKRLASTPAEIAIETTNLCNLDCIMCPRKGMTRPLKAMEIELYRKIVDDAVRVGIKKFLLHNYGEPMLTTDDQFNSYLSYLRSRDQKAYIHLDSNGTLMNKNKIEILVQNSVNKISIAIDGATPETYASVRRGGNLKDVEDNVLKLMEYKKKQGSGLPEVSVAIIEMEETKDEIDMFINKWAGKVDEVHANRYTNRGGTLSSTDREKESFPVPCFRLWRQMVVNNDGTVSLCCNDWNKNHILGDLTKQSITEVWGGSKIRDYRTLHLNGQRDVIPICKPCKPESWDRSFPLYWFQSEEEL